MLNANLFDALCRLWSMAATVGHTAPTIIVKKFFRRHQLQVRRQAARLLGFSHCSIGGHSITLYFYTFGAGQRFMYSSQIAVNET